MEEGAGIGASTGNVEAGVVVAGVILVVTGVAGMILAAAFLAASLVGLLAQFSLQTRDRLLSLLSQRLKSQNSSHSRRLGTRTAPRNSRVLYRKTAHTPDLTDRSISVDRT